MIHSKIPLAQTVTELCKKHGIQHVIISPGSRNAPLTISFTHDPFFTCYSIVDERAAAFFALGMAQKLQTPTALVCTSGSALLNYYPAIAEAYFSRIPLVVLSADRPDHLVGIGDGQTINQPYVFKNHIRYSAVLKLDVNRDKTMKVKALQTAGDFIETDSEHAENLQGEVQAFNEKAINKAINTAYKTSGPVHINIPFDEPLYDTVETLSVSPLKTDLEPSSLGIDSNEIEHFISDWNSASKKMILVGVNPPNSVEQKWLDFLAQDPSVIVLTETTSNLHHESFFTCIDQLITPLSEEERKDIRPNILLTFGGLIVSKRIKALLRKHQPDQHWHVDLLQANDTFFCLNRHIKSTPNLFFETLLTQVEPHLESPYFPKWQSKNQLRIERHDAYVDNIPYCDFLVFHHVLESLPNKINLHVANSSAIRYLQLFQLNKTIEVFCNRGTSGIDGSTSTAIGYAVQSENQTVFITGDLSFFYDSNALWNKYIPKNFRIILLNNNGGGIFRILPGEKNTPNFDTYFETTHELTAAHLCKMFGFTYRKAHSEDTLQQELKDFFEDQDQPQLLEVFTPRTLNDSILLHYFEFLK
ncbi:2-succinyl-5-enolpyruvyl-6-hydroxy-3-cyclohexene-1-carboxylate synthase [Gaetbulibacter aestuarii]|uniref:2-succinyl-5-enolpyruvyl-6-hydroxy-3-cyclohexene-1-carboxylate synthase n=1 Tax=Gaetbulibacter aestuarii TaxID=1502358 RepID=A0ABW7MZI0_9FLAO